MIGDSYEVLAVRYGHLERRSHENFYGGDTHDVAMPLDYFVWVIRNEQRTFLVDTGFDQEKGDKRGRSIVRPVADGLKAIGLEPASVKDIVISHMHYDHAGNNDLFPLAKYHLQDAEMAYCTGRCMCHQATRMPFEADDVASMVRKLFEGRLQFHDGNSELAPGITLHKVGGHSRGLQVVRVKTARGYVVIGSDAAHFYANMERGKPFPVFDTLGAVLEGVECMRRLASSESHIIPGHDPLVLER
ncbi:MAG: N-acyl homoserine lactonase family protein, partial [Sideroxyarcus sp.]|nr:N-acyl homoserine lactonase family protein [Sideroxyarcus sp.]